MEEKTDNIMAIVKSPAKDTHSRKGSGFSLAEIRAAGRTIILLKELNISIDYFRKSASSENIEIIKNLKEPKKGKKRSPFVPKTKKVRVRTKKLRERVSTPEKVVEKPEELEPEVKDKAPKAKAKAPKAKAKASKKEKVEVEGTPLTELSGLGGATAKKFMELGVNTVEDLCKEDASELGALIKGVSEDRIKKWIDESKEKLS